MKLIKCNSFLIFSSILEGILVMNKQSELVIEHKCSNEKVFQVTVKNNSLLHKGVCKATIKLKSSRKVI